jgi:hypothetical protein
MEHTTNLWRDQPNLPQPRSHRPNGCNRDYGLLRNAALFPKLKRPLDQGCAEIAFDVAREHRKWLSGRDTGHIPINPGSRAYQVFWHLMSFLGSRLLTVDTPLGRKARPKFRAGGGPLIRVKPVHLRAAGVERVLARTVGTRGGLPLLDDGRVLDVANVIWCVGYEHTARWIEVPIDRDNGWPQQQRGVVPSRPGCTSLGCRSCTRSTPRSWSEWSAMPRTWPTRSSLARRSVGA